MTSVPGDADPVRGARLVVRAERLVAGGDALARLDDGRVVFVAGALPGEEVLVHLDEVRRDFARGRVDEVIEPVAERCLPPCRALAAGCGGCNWQHATPAAQLRWKADIVTESLRRTARLAAQVRVGAAVAPWGYRTSLRLAIDQLGRPGLREAGSHRVVALADCPVAHPTLASLLGEVRLEGREEVSLRVSAATGEATAWWPVQRGSRNPAPNLPSHVATGPDAKLTEVVRGVPLRVSAASFFQSGPAAAELVVDAVVAAAPELATAGHVVDAYGGVGLFAATAVPAAARVTLLEGSPSACADARHNLAHRSAAVVNTPVEQWRPLAADVVVADPSRAGLRREAAAVLAACGAPVLVLVSCDPVALARDASLLAPLGYRHVESTVLDLFPHTHHVETVTRFERTTT